MTSWLYLLQTIGGCAAGFVAGYLVGRTARDVHRIATVVAEGEPVSPSPRHRLRPSWRAAVALVLVVLGLVTVILGLAQSAATRRITECHTVYANNMADALDTRSRGSQQAQDALDALMTSVAALGTSPPVNEADAADRQERARQAITNYVAKRAQAKQLLAQNPYPAPPRTACPTN
ncbi:hypothetical protein JNUCC0626_20100 [Lentzea sp. JNUCC 0626]|uniref:hypothetical protein n=1 Tax=Lentzea sp. JNUCC 0626 TaxID=3367513 RepID=UPI00374A1EB3